MKYTFKVKTPTEDDDLCLREFNEYEILKTFIIKDHKFIKFSLPDNSIRGRQLEQLVFKFPHEEELLNKLMLIQNII